MGRLSPYHNRFIPEAAFVPTTKKHGRKKELASNESNRIKSNTLHDADIYYWNAVAQHELVFVAQAFRTSIQQLVEVVRHRVEVEYIDRNDLLMAEVKLNDADFQLLQTRDNAEIARLALNSFAGVNPSDTFADRSFRNRPQTIYPFIG